MSEGLFWAAVSLASGSSKVIPAERYELRGGQLLHGASWAQGRATVRHPSLVWPPATPRLQTLWVLAKPFCPEAGRSEAREDSGTETQDWRHLEGRCVFLPGLDSVDRSRVAAPAAQAVLVRTQWPRSTLGNGEPGSGGPQS